jgi:UDP-N-acetylmuramoylalanine--D-glutamate ligase
MRLCPAPIIGITGSSGKSTTTSLVAQILERAGLTTWVGGNIGRPLLEYVEVMAPAHKVVMELSSFQLEMADSSPHLAAILNIAPDHLDRHASLIEYTQAKANILRFQDPSDWAVLGWEDAGAWSLAPSSSGHLAGFGLVEREGNGCFLRRGEIVVRVEGDEETICPSEWVKLPGKHNLRNALAATLLARLAGADAASIAQGISEFEGLPHRLELVRELKGVRYYNDSIATSPARTLAALASFSQPIVLLAGGRDKNLPLEDLGAAIRQRVRLLILFGETAEKLEQAAVGGKNSNALPQVVRVADLSQAVERAAERSRPGEVVLLSPAGTSFDMYRDYAERGEHFRTLVREL